MGFPIPFFGNKLNLFLKIELEQDEKDLIHSHNLREVLIRQDAENKKDLTTKGFKYIKNFFVYIFAYGMYSALVWMMNFPVFWAFVVFAALVAYHINKASKEVIMVRNLVTGMDFTALNILSLIETEQTAREIASEFSCLIEMARTWGENEVLDVVPCSDHMEPSEKERLFSSLKEEMRAEVQAEEKQKIESEIERRKGVPEITAEIESVEIHGKA